MSSVSHYLHVLWSQDDNSRFSHHMKLREKTVSFPMPQFYQVFHVAPVVNANAGDIRDLGLIPGLGRSIGGGHGNPLQYSCQENPMDRETWWATVHRVTKSWTGLKQLSMHLFYQQGKPVPKASSSLPLMFHWPKLRLMPSPNQFCAWGIQPPSLAWTNQNFLRLQWGRGGDIRTIARLCWHGTRQSCWVCIQQYMPQWLVKVEVSKWGFLPDPVETILVGYCEVGCFGWYIVLTSLRLSHICYSAHIHCLQMNLLSH